MYTLTCSEVNDNVYKEYRVGEAVEGDPSRAQIVVEETNGDRQDDEIGY